MQLRLLSTMSEVAAERNSTLVFPVPVELLRFFDSTARATTGGSAAPATPPPTDAGPGEV